MAPSAEELGVRRRSAMMGILGAAVLMLLCRPLVGTTPPTHLLFFGDISDWPSYLLSFWPLDFLTLAVMLGSFQYGVTRDMTKEPANPVGWLKFGLSMMTMLGGLIGACVGIIGGWLSAWIVSIAAALAIAVAALAVFAVVKLIAWLAPIVVRGWRSLWALPVMEMVASDGKYVGDRLSTSLASRGMRRLANYLNPKDNAPQ